MKHSARANWLAAACLAIALAWGGSTPAQAGEDPAKPSAIPLEAARQVFAQATRLCERDGGRLWGASLCAPIMLVDPKSRRIVANQADAQGVLEPHEGVYTGVMPSDRNVANTATEWSGTRWTQMLWPLPEERRTVLIAHELFHNLQPRLDIAAIDRSRNAHLGTLEGRYYLQLEWRALASALQATQPETRTAAIADALAFRRRRYALFPQAERSETALELREGLAEYTGVVVGNPDPASRRQAALHDLSMLVELDASFVRSFAYATGPAYGLLLDRLRPGWKSRLGSGQSPAALLGEAIGKETVAAVDTTAAASRYDGASLRQVEVRRERQRLARAARNRARFVDGAVLVLPFQDMNVQFNPSNLQPLEGFGTVYPNLRITDHWGTLEVENGALMKEDWSAVVVTAPQDADARPVHGDGWTLRLEPGWELVRGPDEGDYRLQQVAP